MSSLAQWMLIERSGASPSGMNFSPDRSTARKLSLAAEAPLLVKCRARSFFTGAQHARLRRHRNPVSHTTHIWMNPFMYRLLFSGLTLLALAACAMGPSRGGPEAKVIGESQYCGTASQDSAISYFANGSVFGDWADYRGINEFDADMARNNGVVVVEMGQRPTGGYNIKLDKNKTALENSTLTIGMEWNAPRLDAAVSQALIASCVAIRPPNGDYDSVRVVDQLGNLRGETRVTR